MRAIIEKHHMKCRIPIALTAINFAILATTAVLIYRHPSFDRYEQVKASSTVVCGMEWFETEKLLVTKATFSNSEGATIASFEWKPPEMELEIIVQSSFIYRVSENGVVKTLGTRNIDYTHIPK